MNRGEVYWFDFGARAKRVPVVVLTGAGSLPHLSTATVAAISSTIRGTRSEVALSPADGLPHACVVNLHQLHTVEQGDLRGRITQLSAAVMHEVDRSLTFALGFGERTSGE